MWIEKLFIKSDHNTEATKLLFDDIIKRKPVDLFILGDVVSLAHKKKRWKAMDNYLKTVREEGIPVYALLGNHDVMGNAKKGEELFHKRFPEQVDTGYYEVVDSIALVLLNSNFKKLSSKEQARQQLFYEQALHALDADPAVKFIVVTCHHAPYSNSKIVGSNTRVQTMWVPPFIESAKAKLFITGHAHAFERFQIQGKDFLTIGGGGGLHHPLRQGKGSLPNQAPGYNPEFHYITLRPSKNALEVISYELMKDFSRVEKGYSFTVSGSPR
jgi:UDP-2,3-diacylglucosamine pyrophosphatase LpxH